MGLIYERVDIDAAHSEGRGASVSTGQISLKLATLIAAISQTPTCVLPAVVDDPYLEKRDIPSPL
jgi:hypothetical protein